MKTLATIILVALSAPIAHATPVEKILVLADSHGVGPFGFELLERLRQIPGAQVDLHAFGGSAPLWFEKGTFSKCGFSKHADNATPASKTPCGPLHTPLLKDLLPGLEGQLVLVELGANLIGSPKEFVEKTTRQMVERIQLAGARCLWVGPPVMRRFGDAKIALNIEQLLLALKGDSRYPACEFVDSRPLTSYPAVGGDGVHYSFPAGVPIAKNWATEIAAEVQKRIR